MTRRGNRVPYPKAVEFSPVATQTRDGGESVIPIFMRQRRRVQLLAAQAPLRQVAVHECDKPVVVRALDQVREFMNKNIFEALWRLVRQFEIQPDAARLHIARALARFHFSDPPRGRFHPEERLPFFKQCRDARLESFTIPGFEHTLAPSQRSISADV